MFHAVLSSVLNGVCPWIRWCCCPEGCFFQAVGSIDVRSMWSCLVPHLDMMQGLSNTCSFMCLSGPRFRKLVNAVQPKTQGHKASNSSEIPFPRENGRVCLQTLFSRLGNAFSFQVSERGIFIQYVLEKQSTQYSHKQSLIWSCTWLMLRHVYCLCAFCCRKTQHNGLSHFSPQKPLTWVTLESPCLSVCSAAWTPAPRHRCSSALWNQCRQLKHPQSKLCRSV